MGDRFTQGAYRVELIEWRAGERVSSQRRYHIHNPLGSGAFGTVYRATLTGEGGFQKDVAIKVLNNDVEGWDEIARRLRDEARMLGLLRHRALLQVDGLVQMGGRWAVVMEYVKGASLLAVLKTGRRMPVGAALELVGEVAGALAVAWESPGPDGEPLRLVHRDIKPSNIQLSAVGEAKLLDFGIARAEFGDRESETQEMVLGSPGYMAPERFDMEDGPEGDIYSLAVTMCELISARKFGRSSANEKKHQSHVDGALGKVRKKIGDGIEPIEGLLRAMLAYEPADRPTAKEVERMARSIRSEVGGMWLAEFCEEVVPDLITKGESGTPDDMCGQTLVEGADGASFTSEVARPPLDEDELPGLITPFQAGVVAALLIGVSGFALVVGLSLLDRDDAQSTDIATPPPSAPTEPSPEAPAPAGPDLVEPDTDDPTDEQPPVQPETPPPAGDGVAEAAAPPAKDDAPPPAEVPAPDRPAKPPAPVASPSAFADWLTDHPEWSRDVAQAEGRADANYLSRWTDGTPPSDTAWVSEVTWGAAAAFCGSRGLPDIDAPPLTWSYPNEGPLMEYRVSGGRPAWRQYDGTTSTAQSRSDSTAFVGFRCAN